MVCFYRESVYKASRMESLEVVQCNSWPNDLLVSLKVSKNASNVAVRPIYFTNNSLWNVLRVLECLCVCLSLCFGGVSVCICACVCHAHICVL